MPSSAAATVGLGAASLSAGFRLEPAVVNVPSPNRHGRDVNVLRHATDVTLALSAGIGSGLELTLVVPAGLYQRGAGIKGVTHQAAPPIAAQALHDPRAGLGFELPRPLPWLEGKLRLELSLPLGSRDALTGGASVVTSPSVVWLAQAGGFFAGAELGVRLRRPQELYGSRLGSQAALLAGVGYELGRPRVAFTAEAYALPSLVRAARASYTPAEWLAGVRYTPAALPRLTLALSGGSGIPLSSREGDHVFAFGVPKLRTLLQLHWSR